MTAVRTSVSSTLLSPEQYQEAINIALGAAVRTGEEALVEAVAGPGGTIRNSPIGFRQTVDTGQLVNSVQPIPVSDPFTWPREAGITASAFHASFMERGAGPWTKFPPKTPIVAWIKRRLRLPSRPASKKRTRKASATPKQRKPRRTAKNRQHRPIRYAEDMYYAMARKLMREGMEGRWYMRRAVRAEERNVKLAISRRFGSFVEELLDRAHKGAA